MGIVDNCTSENDSEDPIGTSHPIVLRDVCILSNCYTDTTWSPSTAHVRFSIRNRIKEVVNPEELTRMLELDFSENDRESKPLSLEDKQFLTVMKKDIHMIDGHYEMPLPFLETTPSLRNNREMALQRLSHLKR